MVRKSIKEKVDFKIPAEVLRPVQKFLHLELNKLLRKRKKAEKDDPFRDQERVDDNAADDTEAAEQSGHARAEAITDHFNKRIVQVRKALARVKVGKYGICEECGCFINTKRLMAFPETTRCIKCNRKKDS